MVVGGQDIVAQRMKLSKKPHLIVATPGRLVDHIRNDSTFSLSRLKFFVLDEADRLLGNEGLRRALDEILKFLPKKRQTLLFSATMQDSWKELELKDPFTCSVAEE